MKLNDYILAKASETDQITKGTFSAGTYSIGLLRPTASRDPFHAQVIDPSDSVAVTDFFEDLTFIHEMTHLVQFITSSFGNEYARSLITASAKLRHQGKLKFPLTFLSDDHHGMRTYESLEEFQGYSSQLSEGISAKAGGDFTAHSAFVSYPYHPGTGFDPTRSASEMTAAIRKISPVLHSKTFLAFEVEDGFDLIECNAAALFEAYAVATELEYIFRNFPELGQDITQRVGFTRAYIHRLPKIYRVAFVAYWDSFDHSIHYELEHIKALIDIALMYNSEPSMHQARWSGAAGRRFYTSPFDVYIAACDAAKRVKRMQSASAQEFDRFQNDVCAELEIPFVKELLKVTLSEIPTAPNEPISVNEIFASLVEIGRASNLVLQFIHREALKIRRDNQEAFGNHLSTPNFLKGFYNKFGSIFSIFDMETKQAPTFESPMQMAVAVHGQTLREFFKGEKPHACPLKLGSPFFCASAEHKAACAFWGPDGQLSAVCPFHDFYGPVLAD